MAEKSYHELKREALLDVTVADIAMWFLWLMVGIQVGLVWAQSIRT